MMMLGQSGVGSAMSLRNEAKDFDLDAMRGKQEVKSLEVEIPVLQTLREDLSDAWIEAVAK